MVDRSEVFGGFLKSGNWDDRLARGRHNSFDAVRLILASLVVLEHSFFLLENSFERDPLYVFSDGQSNCGQLAVYLFFVISGFLVTQSWIMDPNLVRYLARRVARIVPGFFTASIIGFLVVAPLASDAPLRYFMAQKWLAIVAQVIALKQASVAGAFAHNPVQLVHGTLWTIQYEFDCYLLVAVLGVAGLLRRRSLITYLVLAVALSTAFVFRDRLPIINYGWLSFLISSPNGWPNLLPFFICGSAFYIFRRWIPRSILLFCTSLVALLLTAMYGYFYVTCIFCGTYALLFIALSTETNIKVLRRSVDLSYGIYLYGWLVEQVLIYVFRDRLTPPTLFVCAMPIICAVAWVSWTFIEAPCLTLVRGRKIRPAKTIETGPTANEHVALLG